MVDFVATGGYALKAYERFAKIRQTKDGRWRVANPMVAQRYRMNVGTIVEADMLKVRLVRSRATGKGHTGPIARGGRVLGEVEEYFIEMLVPGDTFVFAGEILKYEAFVENEVYVSRSASEDPKVPAYEGGKFPLSTYLADRVRRLLAEPNTGRSSRSRCANGCASSNGVRSCLGKATCWSRHSRAATNFISSVTRSRGGSRTRRSACC